ncbi:tail fiber protein [Aeromonas phage 60AhydR15PP]|uniref:Long tail fiber protein Gp37 n=1 Tax=Aeromonas phage 60AhydR15PP TaxID=2163979 RepID=A0A2S1PGM7_9CAUD|nr:tail fiber protein [Aeromonas phage 60AhydR15PP]AWH15718.1 small distal tail fiber subunit [Aeromonas phage 60AhydR15PP]
MADLKVGTTVGGSPVWHQGNLALVPSGNAILYKGARIYSENDKPSANELQVVSRAGDTMSGALNIETSTDYPLALKSSVSGPAYIRFSKGNTLQSYVGTDAAGDFKVAMTDVNGSWAFDGLKIAKSNGDVSLKGALVSANTGNFDIKYGSVQFIRANSSKNVYIGAPGGTDLVLGYAQDGMTTTKIRFDSAVYNKTGGLLISDTGLIQRSAMDNPYYNQTEADARFIRLNTNTATTGYLLSRSSDMGTPHNLSMGYAGFFRHNGLSGFRDLTINVSTPSSSNGAHARGITFDYGSIGYGMYTYAYDSAGTKLANQKIYTEADKPTPAEIGALAAGANAVSASKLQTARTISLTGGATGSVSFDGSANVSLAVTVTNDSHTHSDYVKKIGDIMSGNLAVPKVLLSAAQGAEANSVARRDFVESTVTASGKGVKDLTIALPAGAPTSGYIPVLFKTYGTSNSFVFIDTLTGHESHPMNNCSFTGNVRASGWGDGGSYAVGQFTIYSTSERAIHSIHGPSEAVDGFVVYVETRAFPIRVRVDIETAVTAYATDVTYGTSIFAVNGQVSGNTKTIVLANFDKGSGTYNGSNRVYDNGYNPTPEAVGALPVNGNAVTASRLQTARLIAGVPFDGTSNISISATNVGAVAKAGDAMTGGLTFVDAACELGWVFNSDYAKIGFKNASGDDTDSYMWFKTGDNGNEYFKWQSVNGANTTDWMSLKPTGLVVAAGVTAPTFTGALAGNAATATKLATARQINGTNFDGSGNITTANWGTARTLTIGNAAKSVNGAGDVSWSLSEIGALPVAGGTVSGMLGVTGILDLVGSSADDMADIVWRAPDGTERGRLWIGGTIGADNSLTWRSGASGATYKIYHEGNKPTASDVGALSIAGGEMGGVVAFRGSANLLNVTDGAKIRYFNGNSAWFHTSVNAAGEFEVSTGGVGETSIATIDYSGKIRTSNQGVLYGDRSKPTASDVGAAPAGFGLGEYGRVIGSVLGDTPLRRQSGFFQGSNIAGIPNTGWTYLFNQAHGDAAGYFGYLAINFAGTQAWIGGQEGGTQRGPYELVKQNDRFVAQNAVGNDYNQCAIEVNGNTAIDSRPGIGFHMPGRFASTLHLWEGGDFRFHTQGFGSYAGIMTGNVNANDVYIRSDRRLKKNLVEVRDALRKVSSLTAYSYDKKQTLEATEYDKKEVGLIAQDVEQVLPEAVTRVVDSSNKDGTEILTLSNSALIALLVGAVKELSEKVKELEYGRT